MLVAVAVLAVLAGLLAGPLVDILRAQVRARRDGEALARNVAALDLLARDARQAARISIEGPDEIRLLGGAGGTVVWRVAPDAATRTRGASSTRLPLAADDPAFARDDTSVYLRGAFEGIGPVRRRLVPRVDGF